MTAGLVGSRDGPRGLEGAAAEVGNNRSGIPVSDLHTQPKQHQRPDALVGGVEDRPARGGRVGGRQLAPGDAVGDDPGQLAGGRRCRG